MQPGLEPGQERAAPARQFLLHEEFIGRKRGHRPVGHRQGQLVFDPGQIARFASQGRQQLGARLFQAHDQRAGREGRRIFQALRDSLFDPDPGRLQLRVLGPGNLLQRRHQRGNMLVQQPNPGVEIGEVQILLAHQHLFQVADEAHDLVIVGQYLLETAPDLSQLRSRGVGSLFAAEKIKQTHKLP